MQTTKIMHWLLLNYSKYFDSEVRLLVLKFSFRGFFVWSLFINVALSALSGITIYSERESEREREREREREKEKDRYFYMLTVFLS